MFHFGFFRAAECLRPLVYVVAAGVVASLIGGMGVQPGSSAKPPAAPTALPAGTAKTITPGSVVVLNKAQANGMLFAPGERAAGLEFSVGDGPHEVVLAGNRAIVSNYGGPVAGQSLAVVDLVNPESTRTIMLGDYRRPHGLALFKDGKHVMVTAEVNQSIIKVDIEAGTIVKTWETGQQGSHMVVLSHDERTAYVTNVGSGSVTIIDLEAEMNPQKAKPGWMNPVSIPTAPGAEGLGLSPDGKELWVANNKSDSISIVDTAARKVVATVQCAKYPLRVTFTPDGKHVLAAASASGEIIFYDAATRGEVARVSTTPGEGVESDPVVPEGPFKGSSVPIGIVIEPDGKHAFVACTATGTIAKIDLATRTVVEHLRTGKGPDGIGLVP
jgi:YVTN family beta-propeller protein